MTTARLDASLRGRLRPGVSVPWTPLSASGTPALVDLDFEHAKFYFNGTTYGTFAAVIAAIGGGADNGDGTYRLGPVSNLPFAGYNVLAGTIVCDYTMSDISVLQVSYQVKTTGAATANYYHEATATDSGGTRVNELHVNRASVNQVSIFSNAAQWPLLNGQRVRSLVALEANNFALYHNGVLVGEDLVGASMPVAETNLAVMLGKGMSGGSPLQGSLHRWAYFPSRLPAAVADILAKPDDMLSNGAWSTDIEAVLRSNDGSTLIASVCNGNTSDKIVVEAKNGSPFVLKTFANANDDHNAPAIIRRSTDGRYIAHYCDHTLLGAGSTHMYQRISTNPDDVSAWGAEIDLGATFGGNGFMEYMKMHELSSGLYHFGKMVMPSTNRGTYYAVSVNKAANNLTTDWSALTEFLSGGGSTWGPYARVNKSGSNRIDCLLMDGHPDDTLNSVRFIYFDGTNWKTLGGQTLSLPITPTTDLTDASAVVWGYAARGNIKGSIENVPVRDSNDNPVVLFKDFGVEDDGTNTHYNRGKWNGSSWDIEQICLAGGPPSGSPQLIHYVGGSCIDESNPDRMWASIKDVNDHFDIWQGNRNSNGTWSMSRLTNDGVTNFRPYKIPGVSKVAYLSGIYNDIDSFFLRVRVLSV